MPFKSLAQEGYLHSHPEILGKEKLAEFDAATKGRHLPEHSKGDPPVAKKKTQIVHLSKKGESFKIHPGALHRALHVAEGKPLGQARIDKALHSKDPSIRHMAASGKGLTAMHKGGK
jgi:hypothetical protein